MTCQSCHAAPATHKVNVIRLEVQPAGVGLLLVNRCLACAESLLAERVAIRDAVVAAQAAKEVK